MNLFKNKVVLITGHTGFKGSWLTIWLTSLGAQVVGMSKDIPSDPSNFSSSKVANLIEDYRVDVCNTKSVRKIVEECQPDFVFHLAAQALVRPSYKAPLETMYSNALGTANVLDALRFLKKNVVAVMITSDKVYDNVEWVWGYRETDRLGGKDPYSASKGMAELAIRSYNESFFNAEDSNIRVAVARAGNVIGGGDWALDRIVPDCIKSWSQGVSVDIRNPWATRPWQHVLEPLSGYLILATKLAEKSDYHGEAYNFGPSENNNYPVGRLIDEMSKYWENACWNDISKEQRHLHVAGLLKLNCDKALFDLGWEPTMKFEETVKMTVEWYKFFYNDKGGSMYDVSISQIEEYTKLANARKMLWAL